MPSTGRETQEPLLNDKPIITQAEILQNEMINDYVCNKLQSRKSIESTEQERRLTQRQQHWKTLNLAENVLKTKRLSLKSP